VTYRYEEPLPPAPTDPATGKRLPTSDPYVADGAHFVRNFGASCDMHDDSPGKEQ
jgi:hypothetical protein